MILHRCDGTTSCAENLASKRANDIVLLQCLSRLRLLPFFSHHTDWPHYSIRSSSFSPLILSAFHSMTAKFPPECSSTLFIHSISLLALALSVLFVVWVAYRLEFIIYHLLLYQHFPGPIQASLPHEWVWSRLM
jgi:hypothetical protein